MGLFGKSFNASQFAAQTSLTYSAVETMFQGTYAGYPVFVKYVPQQKYLLFSLFGKPSNFDIDLARWYETWQIEHVGISSIQYQDNCLRARINLSKDNPTFDAVSLFAQLAESAAQHRLIPCCTSCGAETGFQSYSYNGTGLCLCPICAEKIEATATQRQDYLSSQSANPLGILLGAAAGALALFLMTYFLYQLGYLAYVSGALGVFIAVICVKKFSGTLSLGGIIISVALCLIVAIFTPYFCIAQDLAEGFTEEAAEMEEDAEGYETMRTWVAEYTPSEFNELFEGEITYEDMEESLEFYDIVNAHCTTKECLSDFSELLSLDEEHSLRHELIKEILWGVLSVIVSACCIIPSHYGEANGKFSFRKM